MFFLNRVYTAENFRILKQGLKVQGPSFLWSAIRTKLNQWFEPDRPKQKPFIMHIETTSRCNLRCPSCAHSELEGKGSDMNLENFKKLIDQQKGLGKVILYGIGETLLHPDIFEMVRYVKKRGIYTGFFTNGTLLTERFRSEILKNGQDYLNISIDGASKVSFEKQRAGANFEKVIANVKAFMAEAKQAGSPIDVAVWNCLTDDNISEVPDLVSLVHEMGVSKLVLQDIMFWNREGIEQEFSQKVLDAKRVQRNDYFKKGAEEAKRLGISLDLLMSAGDGKRRCQVPWYFSYITAQGLATPCNWHGWDGEKLNFGNVNERGFEEVWNDKSYVQFRKEMRQKEIPEFCEKCPMYDREMIKLA